jgi:two-component system, sensor histidine kinase and response regulator
MPESSRILVVEDDPTSQQVATAMLSKLGYAVDIAASASAAVAAALERNYALIFVECQIDGGEGFRATREIRNSDGPSAYAPIVALTVLDDAPACRAAGMDGHLRKPVRLSDLVRVVDEWS